MMQPITTGSEAPPIPGADAAPRVVAFYKVTCPTCQVAAEPMERLYQAFPDRFVAVVQDPSDRAEAFNREFGSTFPPVVDTEPYDLSNAYGVRTVPTLFVIEDHTVTDVVESWDREGWNRVGERLGELTGTGPVVVSEEGDGLPSFKPG